MVHRCQERSVNSPSNVVVQQLNRLVDLIERVGILHIRYRNARFCRRSKASHNWIISSVTHCHEENIQRDDCDGRLESSLDLRREQSRNYLSYLL